MTDAAGVGGPGGWPDGRGRLPQAGSRRSRSSLGHVPRLRRRRPARPVRLQLRHLVAGIRPGQDFTLTGGGPGLRAAARLRGLAVLPLPQRGRRHVRGRVAAGRRPGRRRRGRAAKPRRRSASRWASSSATSDGDGWPDLVVANDTVRNFFFHNVRANGSRFEEIGVPSGVGLRRGPAPAAAMGIDWGEYRPGRCAAGHRQLRQRADHASCDWTTRSGCCSPTRPWRTGWPGRAGRR